MQNYFFLLKNFFAFLAKNLAFFAFKFVSLFIKLKISLRLKFKLLFLKLNQNHALYSLNFITIFWNLSSKNYRIKFRVIFFFKFTPADLFFTLEILSV